MGEVDGDGDGLVDAGNASPLANMLGSVEDWLDGGAVRAETTPLPALRCTFRMKGSTACTSEIVHGGLAFG